VDDAIIAAIAAAAYNGICIAPENGETDAYQPDAVSAPAADGSFSIRLADGRLAAVTVAIAGDA
jgi:hypothetical protein